MKAYQAWDAKSVENYSTVVFAETAPKAKAVAMTTDACADAAFIDIRVKRLPEMDGHYRGRSEIKRPPQSWCYVEELEEGGK